MRLYRMLLSLLLAFADALSQEALKHTAEIGREAILTPIFYRLAEQRPEQLHDVSQAHLTRS